MNPTEMQLEAVKIKSMSKITMENLRHQHILEEIEAMKKAKIKSFVRQIREEK